MTGFEFATLSRYLASEYVLPMTATLLWQNEKVCWTKLSESLTAWSFWTEIEFLE
jgi:hypothetical protein